MGKLFAIIDVETTGGQPSYERITEIAIVLHDGERVVDTYSTLLNPEKPIPWGITQLTGITNDMVATAPKFYEVAKKIVEMTTDAVFVAHNVSFDYNFIKAEFQRFGYDFSRKQLCTVRMSRKTFPGLKSYSLSNLKRHFGIDAERSHRALDDTLATVEIFERILAEQEGRVHIKSFINKGIQESKLPQGITLERLHQAPEACGVYYLYDEDKNVIYVGKSINIRKRLLEHFADPTSKGEKMRVGVADFTFEITGSELVALLLESSEIKRLQPRINRAQRIVHYSGAIYTYLDQRGYRCLAIGNRKPSKSKELELVSDYPKIDNAKNHLEALRRQYELCNRLCNLDHGDKACFYYTIHQCRGACVGEETVEDYNARVEEAITTMRNRLKGSYMLLDKGRSPDEQAAIVVLNGQYRGYTYLSIDEATAVPELGLPPKDPEAARIIHNFMESNTMRSKPTVVPLRDFA
jgi:DNA polymerase III subunit epsilon